MHTNPTAPSPRATVRRKPDRARYDRETVHRILDEGLVCHVGFACDEQPIVLPMAYGRAGDRLYLHGAPAGRMMRALAQGAELCATVTHLDGLVLARSAFAHSMNYRSVVIFGRAAVVDDPAEKLEALRALTEQVMPGRWDEVRRPSGAELAGTTVLALSLEEASAKVRSGPPVDHEADYALPVWAGEIPLRLAPGAPIADPRLAAGTPLGAVERYLVTTCAP